MSIEIELNLLTQFKESIKTDLDRLEYLMKEKKKDFMRIETRLQLLNADIAEMVEDQNNKDEEVKKLVIDCVLGDENE